MSDSFLSASHAVTLDASFVVGLCAKEPDKYALAQATIEQRIADGCTLHAPHLLVMEASYVLCGKAQSDTLTPYEYASALANLISILTIISFSPGGDATLVDRAEQFRQGYGCSRSADSFYIALADQLTASSLSELLTFDTGQKSQANAVAPSVTVTLLAASSDAV